MVVGGLGDAKQIDDHSRNAAHAVKAAAEQKTGKTFDTYEPVQYKSQVVAGTNYFVKVHVGNDEYLHLRIYKDLSQNHELSNVQESKSKDDEIVYF